MIFRQRARRSQRVGNWEREGRRRHLAHVTSRSPGVEALEDRRLLAGVEDSLAARIDDHFSTSSGLNGLAVVNVTTGESEVVVNGSIQFGTSSTIKQGVLYNLLRKIDADPS